MFIDLFDVLDVPYQPFNLAECHTYLLISLKLSDPLIFQSLRILVLELCDLVLQLPEVSLSVLVLEDFVLQGDDQLVLVIDSLYKQWSMSFECKDLHGKRQLRR